jgi:hypothetical protein
MLPPDRTKVQVLSTGQVATLLLGPAASSLFLSAAESDLVDGETYDFYLEQGSDWEHSFGVYDATAGTITRTVIKSKIGGVVSTSAMIDLDGSAYLYFPLFQRLFAAVAATGNYDDLINRPIIRLEADTTFHVDYWTGNNANDGLTAGTAWKDPQYAADMMAHVDANGHSVTVKFAAGTWLTNYGTDGYLAVFRFHPLNASVFVVEGDTTTPANVKIELDVAATSTGLVFRDRVDASVRGFEIYSSVVNWAPDGIYAQWHVGIGIWNKGRVSIDNMRWGFLSVMLSIYDFQRSMSETRTSCNASAGLPMCGITPT